MYGECRVSINSETGRLENRKTTAETCLERHKVQEFLLIAAQYPLHLEPQAEVVFASELVIIPLFLLQPIEFAYDFPLKFNSQALVVFVSDRRDA
jgi:hypothetical protein